MELSEEWFMDCVLIDNEDNNLFRRSAHSFHSMNHIFHTIIFKYKKITVFSNVQQARQFRTLDEPDVESVNFTTLSLCRKLAISKHLNFEQFLGKVTLFMFIDISEYVLHTFAATCKYFDYLT